MNDNVPHWRVPKNAKLLSFAPYWVSNDGSIVYSLLSGRTIVQHPKSLGIGGLLGKGARGPAGKTGGPLRVYLRHHDGTCHWHEVGRLVAQCFVVNYKVSSHKIVAYKDNNKQNNNYKNLVWIARKDVTFYGSTR